MRTLTVKRVSYGTKDVPEDQREYTSPFSSAVGCQADWLSFARANGFEQVEFLDRMHETITRVVFDAQKGA